jgi:hypothetical protein
MSDSAHVPPSGVRDVRRHALETVAERAGGEFIKGRVTGGYAVNIRHGPWSMTLGLHMVSTGSTNSLQTRVLVHFTGRDDFKLLARRRVFLDSLAEKLGFGRRAPGGRQLEERYVVKGRPAPRVRSVLSGGLGDLLMRTEAHRVQVGRASWSQRRKSGPHTRSLQVLEPNVTTDPDRLMEMLELAGATMDVLQRVGIAVEERGWSSTGD